MNKPPKQRWGCLILAGVAIVVGFLLLNMLVPFVHPKTHRMGLQTKAMNNCKQIILSLKQYSKDADSFYPDGRRKGFRSANQVFRELFKEDILYDERIFGAPESIFEPDNVIGTSPEFENALSPGECHWMLLKFQTDVSHHKTPLVIENSLNADWPPKWNVTPPKGERKKGQAWVGREVIIGYNDGRCPWRSFAPTVLWTGILPTTTDSTAKAGLTHSHLSKSRSWNTGTLRRNSPGLRQLCASVGVDCFGLRCGGRCAFMG